MPRKILLTCSDANSLRNFRGRLIASLRESGNEVVAVAPGFPPEIAAWCDELGVSGDHVALLRAIEAAVPEVYGRVLPLNVSGAIAAPMLDLGLPAYTLKAIPLLARTAGLLGHLREEHERPIGFRLAALAEAGIEYDG